MATSLRAVCALGQGLLVIGLVIIATHASAAPRTALNSFAEPTDEVSYATDSSASSKTGNSQASFETDTFVLPAQMCEGGCEEGYATGGDASCDLGGCAMGSCGMGCDPGCGMGSCNLGGCGMSCDPSCGLGCGDACGAGCGNACGPMMGGCNRGGIPGYVYGEFLYLRPTGGDIAHAQQQDGNGGAGTVPFGRIGTIDYDYQPGFRVGGGICLDGCSSINVNYTRFEAEGFDHLAQPNIPGGSGAVGSFVQLPGAGLTASAGPVTATSDLDYHIGEVMFRDLWRSTCNSRLKYVVGGVYASFDQDFQQLGTFSGGQGGAIVVDSTIDFDGGGLKAGLDYERFLSHGLSVYGRASAAAVSGQFTSRYRQFNSSTEVELGNAVWKDNRIISLVEYELGAAYTTCNQRWRVSGGYLFQHWGNMVTGSEFISAVQGNSYVDLGDTLSFDGLTARIEARW